MAEALGLNITFPIYKEDGSTFNDLVLRKPTFDSVIMSLGDKITGDVYYKDANLICSMKEYVVYQGVHYQLVNPPTIVKEGMASDNSDLKGMAKYSFEFYHPMYILSNLPFTDIAVSYDEQQYKSQDKTFFWIGYLQDFINKLDKNLQETDWTCILGQSVTGEKLETLSDVLSFTNNTIADALKVAYDTWEVPFIIEQIESGTTLYNQGKRFAISFGLPSNEIYASADDAESNRPFIFKYGQGVGLKNNSATPKNNKIITRIAGYGSEDNIPYGYPQIVWNGREDDARLRYPLYDGIVGGEYVKLIKHPFTRNHLMPSIYSATVEKKVNPNAYGYNPNIEIIDYYDAANPSIFPHVVNLSAPSYEIHEFSQIKPELGNESIVSVKPINNDTSDADEWVDGIDDDGNYLQSYFKITLPRLDFDLYASAAITQEMQINMRSGSCMGCTFGVQVDWEDYKRNFYDADMKFSPNGEQRDLEKYPNSMDGEIEVIVQKDTNTFGTLMPNSYQAPEGGDQFVILGISLPLSYITNAESKLDEAMMEYMLENNVYYFEYPLKFDEYFIATHTYILSQLRNNTIVRFEFQGQIIPLYVKQITIKYGDKPLPEYSITLTDDVEIVLNQIGQVTEDVSRMRVQVSALQSYFDKSLIAELNNKLSKAHDDVAQGKISFKQGITIGNFQSRFLGSGAIIDKAGNAEFESIYSRSFISTPEFRFNRIAVTEGEQWCTNGYGTIDKVEIIDETQGYITLHLEENDFASVAVGDICRGIYNDIANEYNTPSLDDDSVIYAGANEGEGFGFSSKGGFFTSYFWIKMMVTNQKGECKFLYELRNSSTPHPCNFMKFAQYGSFTNRDRRSSSYATSIGHYYEMVLDGVNTWKLKSANVVYRKGYLGNMTVTLKNGEEATLQGYGLYCQDNVYFGNAIVQLDPETLDDIEGRLKNYIVTFSDHVDVITVDDVGNVIGGIYTIDGDYKQWRIQSAISVRRNNNILTVAADGEDAGAGTYKIYAQPVGCSCKIEDSTLYITGIDNIKDGVAGTEDDIDFDYDAMRNMDACRVDLIIDCEGVGSIQKSFPITIKHSSQPFVSADLSNEISSVSWNTQSQSYIGLPIIFDIKTWHNGEALNIENESDVNIVPSFPSIACTKSIVTVDNKKFARISINSLPIDLPSFSTLSITCSVTYSGILYERTLIHTINKSTDTNVYSLLPSVTEVLVDKDGSMNVNGISCAVFCDSSDDKHYAVPFNSFATHGLVLYYKKFYADGTSDANETIYSNTPVSIDITVSKVEFYLYAYINGTVNRNILHDNEGVPVLVAGSDGEDGIVYSIDAIPESVTILANETQAIYSGYINFYQSVGDVISPKIWYAGIYIRHLDGTRSLVRGSRQNVGGYGTENNPYTINVTSDDDVIEVFCIGSSEDGSLINDYVVKKEIAIFKNGDTGEDGIVYYLTSNINAIIRDANGDYKGSATPTITAWKKTGDQEAIRLCDITTPIVAEGFTINAYEKEGDTTRYTNTSLVGILTCETPHNIADRLEVELVRNTKVYDTMPIPIISEVRGEDGSDGVFPRDCGLFDPDIATNRTFGYAGYIYRKVGDIVIRDKVNYEIDGVMYGFLVKQLSPTTLVTDAPTSASGDDNWESAGIVQTIIANTIFGSNANIGGFMVSHEKMRSSTPAYRTIYKGVFATDTTYEYVMPDATTPARRPLVLHDGSYYVASGTMLGQTFTGGGAPNYSSYWRQARADEVTARNIGDATDVPKFKIEGNLGIIVMRQADDTTYILDDSGKITSGNEDGRRIVVDPNTKSINVFDESDNQVLTINGESRASLGNLYGNDSGYIFANSGKIKTPIGPAVASHNNIVNLASDFTINDSALLTFTGEISSQASYSDSDVWCADVDKEVLRYIQPRQIGSRWRHQSYCKVELVLIKNGGEISVLSSVEQGEDATVNTKSFNSQRYLSAGTYQFAIRYFYALYSDDTANVTWGDLTASWGTTQYIGEIFANGFAFGNSSSNFFGVVKQDNSNLQLKAISNGAYGIEINNQGIKICINGVWYNLSNNNGQATLTAIQN